MEKLEKNTIEETKDTEVVELKNENLEKVSAGSFDDVLKNIGKGLIKELTSDKC
ncbi:MAG: hypothetical protein MJ250_08745 [Alphaproteobacteria bacterium]|nr:hypothetical protein [Alphaproteobacteria bacterium]